MQPDSDQELWIRVRERDDAAAFGALFDRHSRQVYNYCFRRTADWAAAEDLVSVVFLTAWRRRRETTIDDGVLPWLITVAANITRNHQRQLRRHRALLNKLPPVRDEPDLSDDVASRVDDEARMAQILEHVRRLPPLEQEVISLCCFAELSPTDVAVALGVPAGTVRGRLSRARQRLRGMTAAPPSNRRRLRLAAMEKE